MEDCFFETGVVEGCCWMVHGQYCDLSFCQRLSVKPARGVFISHESSNGRGSQRADDSGIDQFDLRLQVRVAGFCLRFSWRSVVRWPALDDVRDENVGSFQPDRL